LVASNAARVEAIERGEEIKVGVNAYNETEVSPLTSGNAHFMVADEAAERGQIMRLQAWRAARDGAKAQAALAKLEAAAKSGANIMLPSIECAKAGVTTGEWSQTLRRAFGEYRAPTGIAASAPPRNDERIGELREAVAKVSQKLGRPLTFLVAKPGLDGHSNGAEQIAIRARDAGMNVIYNGIRFSPDEIVAAAREKKPDVIGLSILSGSHVALAREVAQRLKVENISAKLVAGGIIPAQDEAALKAAGIAAVFGPKDYDLNAIMLEIVALASKP
ncbi:MAG TPA: methylmalonyl-CoA mutase family protein, partial [Rhizomicrobium sp.]|nr:methylmalonyl-CoA mutase family protein [Rhizomicrobium sp.]